jgi:hypothetical protein
MPGSIGGEGLSSGDMRGNRLQFDLRSEREPARLGGEASRCGGHLWELLSPPAVNSP